MFRRSIAATGSFLVIVASSAGLAQERESSVSVRIAKTATAVKPFGTATTSRDDVNVRLLRPRGDSYRRVSSMRVPVKDDGTYRARFDRPRRGECRVVVRVVGTDARDDESFPCYNPRFPMGRATLRSLTETVEIEALIAATDPHRQYGLMYRPKLARDRGMAFLWDADTSGGFWMKNTLIPLSIAFFDSNDVIVRILHMEPCEEEPCEVYDPGVSYRGALEVNQGAFEEWGISEGDTIEVDEGP